MNRSSVLNWISAGALMLGTAALAPADIITCDTYIDSYAGTPDPFIPGNQEMNYGGSASIKVVASPGSTDFPEATSSVRTLIKLPDSFWSSLGVQAVDSTILSFRVRNLNSGNPFTRTVSAYPMLRSFVAGTGFQPTTPGGTTPGTMGGVQNTPENPIGADWLTFDGVHAWGTSGTDNSTSDHDLSNPVVGVVNTDGGITTMRWDLTTLINDPGARDNIHNNGLMIKITDDLSFPSINDPQQFISFYSYEGALAKTNPSTYYPVVNFTVVPEPTTIALIGITIIALGIRPKGRR
ncbi:MAG: PEP-CTERM sorting domain-containing protein [Phycisphaerales bacterium]|nr:PEP-CTERM sorting domain-containing protein [Phycisphaerales bacterium]